MRKNKLISVALFSTVFVFILTLFLGLSNFNKSVKAETGVEFLSYYTLGTEIELPSSQITVAGNKYDTTILVHLPSNKGTIIAKDKLLLNYSGKYIVEYKAIVNGKPYSNKYSFVVHNQLYNVGNIKSKTYYGAHKYNEDKKGVVLSLAPNDTFYYNGIIDFNSKTQNDSLVKFFVTPNQIGQTDVLGIKFTFTDVYDSTNTIDVDVKKILRAGNPNWTETNVFVTSNANGELPVGLEASSTGAYSLDGQKYNLHKNNEYGAPVSFSMSGTPEYNNFTESNIGNQELSISIDYETKRIYAGVNNSYSFVTDLDDLSIYSTAWNGFLSGKAYLSVTAYNYVASSLNLVFTSFGDAEVNNLIKNTGVDIDEPKLTIDLLNYDIDNLPNGIVGKPYKVFNANAIDETDGNVSVDVKVYYQANNNKLFNIELNNGEFVPTVHGKYIIKYHVEDNSGNYVDKILNVNVLKTSPIRCEILPFENETTVTSKVFVGDYVVTGTENAKVNVYAIHKSSGTIYEIDNNELSFIPMKAGQYEIVYEVIDYATIVREVRNLTVTAITKLKLLDKPTLPKYLIRNCVYNLPTISAYDFSTGEAVAVPTKIIVKEDSKVERNLNSNVYAPSASAKTVITYTAGEGENKVSYEETIKVINVGYGDSLRIKDYFVSDAFTSESQGSYIEFTTSAIKTTDGKASLNFINAVQTFDFELRFRMSAEDYKCNKINVYLTDYKDSDKVLKFSYVKKPNGKCAVIINDLEEVLLEDDFISPTGKNLLLAFDDRTDIFSMTSNTNIKVGNFLSGEKFTGFCGQSAYLTIELEGVEGKTSIQLLRLNGQPLTKVVADFIAPKLSSIRPTTIFGKGDEYKTQAVYARDVLDNNLKFNFTVKKPNGEIMVAKDGTVMKSVDPTKQYELVFEEYGSYYFEYICKDSSGNDPEYSYALNVVDDVPPEVTVKTTTKQVKFGDKVVIEQPTVKDNVSETCEVNVLIKDTYGKISYTTDNSFIAKNKGKYTIIYYVVDKANNVTYAYVDVTVV